MSNDLTSQDIYDYIDFMKPAPTTKKIFGFITKTETIDRFKGTRLVEYRWR